MPDQSFPADLPRDAAPGPADDGGGPGERVHPAPLNAAQTPLPRETQPLSRVGKVPVLAYLEWPRFGQYVPAMVVRTAPGRVLVQWWPDPFKPGERHTWLKETDVRRDLRVARGSPHGPGAG
jgi:hypothetical protein